MLYYNYIIIILYYIIFLYILHIYIYIYIHIYLIFICIYAYYVMFNIYFGLPFVNQTWLAGKSLRSTINGGLKGTTY